MADNNVVDFIDPKSRAYLDAIRNIGTKAIQEAAKCLQHGTKSETVLSPEQQVTAVAVALLRSTAQQILENAALISNPGH